MDANEATKRAETWNGYWTMNMGDSPSDEEALSVLSALVESEAGLRAENYALKADIAARKEIMADDFQQIHRLKLELLASRKLTGIAEQQTTRVIDERDALKAEVDTADQRIRALKMEVSQMRNSTAKEVICCRCGKETLFYSIAPYGSVDDGDAICAECLDNPDQSLWKARAEKAEAELSAMRSEADAARPLIQQVEDTIDAYGKDAVLGEAVASLDDALDAYREGKEKP